MREPHCFYGKSGNDLVSIYYVAVFPCRARRVSESCTHACNRSVRSSFASAGIHGIAAPVTRRTAEVSQLEIEH
jgi:hypothetical protein